jgi:hypothetical protein
VRMPRISFSLLIQKPHCPSSIHCLRK